ncbi:CobW/P47K family protein [Streptomyces davaonensis JCM 4913]|uniref:CobW/P47K family protein n=1 Tax=Streptomyces davaonensis (strain DSM 101723 / JCM 4913 / KCC S-0913 / 768) TaxID=1214101 RepID=K4QZB5_STRDJ|nr:CobW/P47K family protein [Streptomyces davaonensis JCM 4913]
MVTVVDAANFLPELDSGDELAEIGLAPYKDDERTVSDLLVDQIEFADVIVLNKLDLVDDASAARLRAALTRLNPLARIIDAVQGQIPLQHVLGTRLFDLDRAQQAPGWVRELNGDHVPETEEYGVSSTVFRADVPFHPERLWTFVPSSPWPSAPGSSFTTAAATRPFSPGAGPEGGSGYGLGYKREKRRCRSRLGALSCSVRLQRGTAL